MLETNVFCVGDEHAENERSNFSQTHTACHQQLTSRPYVKMIATHGYSPLRTSVFSAGLNGLQLNQLDQKNGKRTTAYTQLVPTCSKFVAASNTRIQYFGFGCGLTTIYYIYICAMSTQLLHEKPGSV